MRSSSVLLKYCSIIHAFRALSGFNFIRSRHLNTQTSSTALLDTMKGEVPSSFNNIIADASWIDLNIAASELRPNYTLIMGQCFNWKRIDDADAEGTISSCWIGILNSHPLAIRQLGNTTLFANLLDNKSIREVASKGADSSSSSSGSSSGSSDAALGRLLRDYFQTDYSLEVLYENWAAGCPRMKVVTETLKGVRVVRQDPFECK